MYHLVLHNSELYIYGSISDGILCNLPYYYLNVGIQTFVYVDYYSYDSFLPIE